MSFIRTDWEVNRRSEGPTPPELDEALLSILRSKPRASRLASAVPGSRDVALYSDEGDAVLSFQDGRLQAALLRRYVGDVKQVWSVRDPEGPVWETLRHLAS